MPALFRPSAVGLVWLVLMGATGLSWWLGADHGGTAAAVGVVIVAFFKVRMIGIYYMELGRAPLPLRAVFEVYIVLVPAALIVIYVAS